MQLITVLGVLLFFGVLYLRYKSQPKNRPPRSARQKFKFGKLILAELLAWMAVGYTLQRLNENISGIQHKPSLIERVVFFFSN